MKDFRDVHGPLVTEDTLDSESADRARAAGSRPTERNSSGPRPKRRVGAAGRVVLAVGVTLAAVLCVRAQGTDVTAPVVTITAPANNAHITSLSDISGTVTDETGGSGVTSFPALRLYRYSGGTVQSWNGTAWTATYTNLAAAVPTAPDTAWSVTTALPTSTDLPPARYGIEVSARDAAGNTSALTTRYFFTGTDVTAPTATVATPASGSTVTSLPSLSGSLNNTVSPSGQDTTDLWRVSIAYKRKIPNTSNYMYWYFGGQTWTTTPIGTYLFPSASDTTWLLTTGLPAGVNLLPGDYQIEQYCHDLAYNSSQTLCSFTVAAPPAPTGLTATARGLNADLAWTAPAYPGGTTGSITSYRIERQVSGGAWSTLTTTTGTTYTNSGLTSGTAYGYRVIALDGTNESAPSSTATVTPVTDVTGPVLTTVTPGTESRVSSLSEISGTATDEAGGSGVASFEHFYLRRYSGASTLFWTGTAWITHPTNIAASIPVSPATAWHVTTALPTGANLPSSWYQVEARLQDAAGNLGATKINYFVVGTDVTLPTVTIETPATGTSVTRLPLISATTSNVASPAGQETTDLWRTRVIIYRLASANGLPATPWWDFQAQAWVTGASPFLYDYPSSSSDETVALTSNIPSGANLPLGVYTLIVDTEDYNHNRTAGTYSTFTVVAPPAPTGLTATARGLNADLAWTAPTYPTGTTGSITSYRVERQVSGGAWSALTTTTGTTYTNTGLTSGTACGYRVVALDGTNESAASNTATVTPVTDNIGPTVTLTAPVNGSRVSSLSGISGTAVDEAGGTGVASFQTLTLARRNGAGFLWWNGTDWVGTVFNLAAAVPMAPATAWAVSTAMPSGAKLPPGSYFVAARGCDAASNWGPQVSVSLNIGTDVTPPSAALVTPAPGSKVTSLTAINMTVTNTPGAPGEDVTPIWILSTGLRRLDSATSIWQIWNHTTHAWSNTTGGITFYPTDPSQTTFSVTSDFPTGADFPLGSYAVSVYCYDYGQNTIVGSSGGNFTLVAPPAPTGLVATARGLNTDLAWAAPTYPAGTTGSITSYRVERQVAGGAWSTLTTTTGTAYSDSGLTSGTAYGYRVVALDGTNESAASGTATVTPVTDVTAPTITLTSPVHNTRGTTLSAISGTASDSAGGSGVASFSALYLERFNGASTLYWNGTAWTTTVTSLAASVPVAPATAWSVSSALPTGADLPSSWYIVIAQVRDAAGNYSAAAQNWYSVGTDVTAPTGTISVPANASIVKSLTGASGTTTNTESPAGQETGDLWRVRVFLSRNSDHYYWNVASHTWTLSNPSLYIYYPTSQTDHTWSVPGSYFPAGTDLPPGSYKLQIGINDQSGNSATIMSDFAVEAAPAPAGLTATARGLAADLAWNAPVFSDGSAAPVTGYRVERQVSGGAWSTLTTSTTARTYTDSGLTSGTAYGYRVIALDGTNESAASSTATVTPVTDVTGPTVAITTPANGSRISGLSGISGTAADEAGGTGVASFYTLTLARRNAAGFLWWNGTAWGETVANLSAAVPVAPATAWTVTTAMPSGANLPPGTYLLAARVRDAANNLGTQIGTSFNVGTDVTPPSVVLVTPAPGSKVTSLTAISMTVTNTPGPAGEDVTPIWLVSAGLRRQDATTGALQIWNHTTHTWNATAGGAVFYPSSLNETSFSITSDFPTGADFPLGPYGVSISCFDYGQNLVVGSSGNTFELVAPPAPTGLTATARGLNADLAWTAPVYPAGTTGSITSYRVERQVSGGAWSTLTTTTGTTYSNTGLTSGSVYGYRVIALDGTNESSASNTATITPVTDITAPVVVFTAPTNNAHYSAVPVISGTATDEAGGSGIASFAFMSLYRWSLTGTQLFWNGTVWTTTAFNMAAAVPVAPATAWTLTGTMPTGADLPLGGYGVLVQARDAAGNLSTLVARGFVIGTDTTAPAVTIIAPATGTNMTSLPALTGTTANTASPEGQDTSDLWRVQLLLSRPTSMGSPYWYFSQQQWSPSNLLYTMTAAGTTWSASNGPHNANLLPGTYTLNAYAVDVSNNYSTATSTFTIVAPPVPTALTAVAAASAVNLAWTAPAYPAGTTGSITSYRIERQAGAGAWSTLATTTGTTYVDNTVTAGTAYSYRVYALDGTNESAASNTATATSAALTVSLASTVVEGATLTGTVTRNTPTAAALTVNLASSNTAAATVPATVTIPAGQTSADFTLTAVDDHVLRATQNVTITASATGFVSGTDTVSVTDNDVAGVTVTPVTGLTTTEAPGAGHTATFTVCLTTQPTGDVTIALSSSDTGEGTVAPATLTFTSGNWDETQLVTVTGVPDGIVDGDQPYTVVTAATSTDTSYDGVDVPDVAVTNLDMDTAGLTLALGPTVAEGDTLTGAVSRNTPTADALTVNLSSDDTTEATVPATVTILAGHADATFTLTGVDDGITDGAHDAVITATATGHAAATDTVTVTDISTGAVDALIRKQGDPAFLGNGVVNATAVGQTAAQNAAGNTTKSYDVRVFNRQTAAHTLTLKASASAGGGTWTITFYDGANDITAAITSAEGWTTAAAIDPAASTTIRIDVKPAITVAADTVKTVTLTATTAGDAEASDTIAAVTTKTGLAPPVLSAAGGDSQVLVEWTPVVGATAYTLSRGSSNMGPWTALPDTTATTYLDDAVTNGTTYYYHVTATVATVEGDASNVASATPHVVAHPQVSIADVTDNGIDSVNDTDYIGKNIYNLTGAGQTVFRTTGIGSEMRCLIKIRSTSSATEYYSVKTSDAPQTGWNVKFFDGTADASGQEKTAQVQSSDGWGIALAPDDEGERVVLMVISSTNSATASNSTLVKVVPRAGVSTTSNSDAVQASAGLQSIKRIDWSLDDGVTWNIGTGTGAQAVPRMSKNSVVKFRAIKQDDALNWPGEPFSNPVWHNGGPTARGEEVNLHFPTSPLTIISATCGNTLSLTVPVRPERDVDLSTSSHSILAGSGPLALRQTTLTAKVTDSEDAAAPNLTVRFTAEYADGTDAGVIGAAGTTDDDVTTQADGTASIVWTGGTRAEEVTFKAEVVEAGVNLSDQQNQLTLLPNKSYLNVKPGAWGQDVDGSWSRSITITAWFINQKIQGTNINLNSVVLGADGLPLDGWGLAAPLDASTGCTGSVGTLTVVQHWNPPVTGEEPDDYDIPVNAVLAG